MRQWHWISSALCLAGLLLFAVTGITLNNAAHISASPNTTVVEATLPGDLLRLLRETAASHPAPVSQYDAPLPKALHVWLAETHGLSLPGNAVAEWSSTELYLSLPRPGGDAWLSVDLASGDFLSESTSRGWIAYLNDLHKGRHTGIVWRWFIDLFSVACIVFSLTGLLLLLRQHKARPFTFPVTALGVVIPLLMLLLFIH